MDLSEAEWEDTEDSVSHPHILYTLHTSTLTGFGHLAMFSQLRTAMVKGETGTLTLDVRAAVDKGVSPNNKKNNVLYII